jgi:hypothetical protein
MLWKKNVNYFLVLRRAVIVAARHDPHGQGDLGSMGRLSLSCNSCMLAHCGGANGPGACGVVCGPTYVGAGGDSGATYGVTGGAVDGPPPYGAAPP